MKRQHEGVFAPPVKRRWELTMLEKAGLIAASFESAQRAMWGSTWPHAHCFVSSLLLAPVIRVPLEYRVRVVLGLAANRPHAWVETPEGAIIDPTYGQFDQGPALRVLDPDKWSELGHQRRIVLSEGAEGRYRSFIKPESGKRGWAEYDEVIKLFEDLKTGAM